MFGFKLVTDQRTYELYAPNKLDMQHWLRIFDLILQMNVKSISTKLLTPLMFESKQKRLMESEALPDDESPELPAGPVEKLVPHLSKTLVINKNGATGDCHL